MGNHTKPWETFKNQGDGAGGRSQPTSGSKNIWKQQQTTATEPGVSLWQPWEAEATGSNGTPRRRSRERVPSDQPATAQGEAPKDESIFGQNY